MHHGDHGVQSTIVAGLHRTKLIHEPQQFRLNELKLIVLRLDCTL